MYGKKEYVEELSIEQYKQATRIEKHGNGMGADIPDWDKVRGLSHSNQASAAPPIKGLPLTDCEVFIWTEAHVSLAKAPFNSLVPSRGDTSSLNGSSRLVCEGA